MEKIVRIGLLKLWAVLFCLTFIAVQAMAEESKATATAQMTVEAGKASPKGKLQDYLKPATAYHLNVFGGAKVDMKFVGAVGLGWDFTYSDHPLKNDVSGHYRRLAWDWLHVPIGLGFFYLKPGVSWLLTNVKIPELGVDESSIRPELILDVGTRVGFGSNFALTGGGHAEWALVDKERKTDGTDLDITGNFMSWFAGVMIYF
jgi:hypothetical protein